MKRHTKNYFKYFGYGEQDRILCEMCNCIAVDLHHIHIKGMGGRKTYQENGKTYDIDAVENIIALCRKCHQQAHSGDITKGQLILRHKYTMLETQGYKQK